MSDNQPRKINWSDGGSVTHLWSNIQSRFRRRNCPVCRSTETDPHINNTFGKTLVVLGCWDCGSARVIASINDEGETK